MARAANVTKYVAGGSGDNAISDGYIKAVEKVWIDSYTIAFTNTNTTIDIAVLTPNKKITSIDVEIETSASQTGGTVSLGFSSDSSATSLMPAYTITHNQTRTSISFPAGFINNLGAAGTVSAPGSIGSWPKVTAGTQTTVSIKLNNWTMTTGTVKSIVRYT